MKRRLATAVETIVDHAASAALAAAVAYAGFSKAAEQPQLVRLGATAALAAIAYSISLALLRRVEGSRAGFRLAAFAAEFDPPAEPPELLLTEEHRPEPPVAEAHDEALVLDDVLAEIAADSRVVQLFDAARMPTPGQLDARIRNHLAAGTPAAAAPDATDMLHQALADLRTSLR